MTVRIPQVSVNINDVDEKKTCLVNGRVETEMKHSREYTLICGKEERAPSSNPHDDLPLNHSNKLPWSSKQEDRSNSTSSTSSDWLNPREWMSDSHRRWSTATQKIKNLLAVNDVLTLNKRRDRCRDRAMSVEQKNNFLERFSTRDRRFSGVSFDSRRRENNNHNGTLSNISSMELKDICSEEYRDSKSNITKFGHYFFEQKGCHFLNILFEPYSTFVYYFFMGSDDGNIL